MKVKILIRDNKSKVVREYKDDGSVFVDDENGISCFMWEEGNYSCDCNRGLFFGYAVGLGYEEHACGRDGYSVNIYDENENVLMEEFDLETRPQKEK